MIYHCKRRNYSRVLIILFGIWKEDFLKESSFSRNILKDQSLIKTNEIIVVTFANNKGAYSDRNNHLRSDSFGRNANLHSMHCVNAYGV